MIQLKEAAIETIKRLPEGCTIEDIMYQMNFIAQVLEGLEDVKKGGVITSEELLKKVNEWSK